MLKDHNMIIKCPKVCETTVVTYSIYLLLDSTHCNRVLLSTPNIGGKMTPNDDEVFPQIGAPAFCPHFN